MDLCNINDIKALLARHGFRFSKSMGQNFLIQSWVPKEIAKASGAGPGTGVLEIGPGIGPLTRELSLLADRVAAVELDRSLMPILAETLADRNNVEIVPGPGGGKAARSSSHGVRQPALQHHHSGHHHLSGGWMLLRHHRDDSA